MRIKQYTVSCFLLLLLTIMLAVSFRTIVYINNLLHFSLINNLLYMHTIVCLSIHCLMEFWAIKITLQLFKNIVENFKQVFSRVHTFTFITGSSLVVVSG